MIIYKYPQFNLFNIMFIKLCTCSSKFINESPGKIFFLNHRSTVFLKFT